MACSTCGGSNLALNRNCDCSCGSIGIQALLKMACELPQQQDCVVKIKTSRILTDILCTLSKQCGHDQYFYQTLWTGSAHSSSVLNLSDNMENYDFLAVTHHSGSSHATTNVLPVYFLPSAAQTITFTDVDQTKDSVITGTCGLRGQGAQMNIPAADVALTNVNMTANSTDRKFGDDSIGVIGEPGVEQIQGVTVVNYPC